MDHARWTRHHGIQQCDECSQRIWPGERMLVWIEVCSRFPMPSYPVKRRYCAVCGPLLVDSITTTNSFETGSNAAREAPPCHS